ncbi:MAG TPA: RHS repeat-associated core domain-containing protein [Candidatus Kapabacteria bacterium]|nr:RHS repeat-associated core domain-containing protein [Candidatus Kapabacteria bacterium]
MKKYILISFLFILSFPDIIWSSDENITRISDLLKQFNVYGYSNNKTNQLRTYNVEQSSLNLKYQIPLSTQKLNGYDINVSLTYNGSVSSTSLSYVYNSDSKEGMSWYKLQQNRPAWIIGVNEFAVQVASHNGIYFNCPWYYNDKINNNLPDTTNDSGMVWLIDGYDICNSTKFNGNLNNRSQDVIRLLKSDGSLLELYNSNMVPNTGVSPLADEYYTGFYYSNDHISKGYAIVEYMPLKYPSFQNNIYRLLKDNAQGILDMTYLDIFDDYSNDLSKLNFFRPRRLYYYSGDGLVYIFEEAKMNYGYNGFGKENNSFFSDFGSNSSSFTTGIVGYNNNNSTILNGPVLYPTIFYLKELRSDNGYLIDLTYNNYDVYGNEHKINYPKIGRQKLLRFLGHEFHYSNFSWSINATGNNYKLHFNNFTYNGYNDNNMGFNYSNKTFGNLTPIDGTAFVGSASYGMYFSTLGYITQFDINNTPYVVFDYESYEKLYSNISFPNPVLEASAKVKMQNQRMKNIFENVSIIKGDSITSDTNFKQMLHFDYFIDNTILHDIDVVNENSYDASMKIANNMVRSIEEYEEYDNNLVYSVFYDPIFGMLNQRGYPGYYEFKVIETYPQSNDTIETISKYEMIYLDNPLNNNNKFPEITLTNLTEQTKIYAKPNQPQYKVKIENEYHRPSDSSYYNYLYKSRQYESFGNSEYFLKSLTMTSPYFDESSLLFSLADDSVNKKICRLPSIDTTFTFSSKDTNNYLMKKIRKFKHFAHDFGLNNPLIPTIIKQQNISSKDKSQVTNEPTFLETACININDTIVPSRFFIPYEESTYDWDDNLLGSKTYTIIDNLYLNSVFTGLRGKISENYSSGYNDSIPRLITKTSYNHYPDSLYNNSCCMNDNGDYGIEIISNNTCYNNGSIKAIEDIFGHKLYNYYHLPAVYNGSNTGYYHSNIITPIEKTFDINNNKTLITPFLICKDNLQYDINSNTYINKEHLLFQNSNSKGFITETFDKNQNISSYFYDSFDRISKIVLPYDFFDTQFQAILKGDTLSTNTFIYSKRWHDYDNYYCCIQNGVINTDCSEELHHISNINGDTTIYNYFIDLHNFIRLEPFDYCTDSLNCQPNENISEEDCVPEQKINKSNEKLQTISWSKKNPYKIFNEIRDTLVCEWRLKDSRMISFLSLDSIKFVFQINQISDDIDIEVLFSFLSDPSYTITKPFSLMQSNFQPGINAFEITFNASYNPVEINNFLNELNNHIGNGNLDESSFIRIFSKEENKFARFYNTVDIKIYGDFQKYADPSYIHAYTAKYYYYDLDQKTCIQQNFEGTQFLADGSAIIEPIQFNYHYNSQGKVTQKYTYNKGSDFTEFSGYNRRGELNWDRNSRGDTVFYQYNPLGELIQTRYPNNNETNIFYDVGNEAHFDIIDNYFGFCRSVTKVEKSIDNIHLDSIVTFYDAMDRVRQVKEIRKGLNPNNLVNTIIKPTKYYYNNRNLLSHVINNYNDTTKYWYDKWGNISYKFQNEIGYSSYRYNSRNELRFSQTQRQFDSSLIAFNQYDDLGRLILAGEAKIINPLAIDPYINESILNEPHTQVDDTSYYKYQFNRLTDIIQNPDIIQNGLSLSEKVTNITLWSEPIGNIDVPYSFSDLSKNYGFFNEQQMDVNLKLFDSPDSYYMPIPSFINKFKYHTDRFKNELSTMTDFENVQTHLSNVRMVNHYDELPPIKGSVWGEFHNHNIWNQLSPTNYVRNLHGRKSAIAYREQGDQPFNFIVFSYDARGRVEAMLRYTETIGFDAIYYQYNSMDAPTKITVCDGLRSMNIWYGYDEFGRVDTVWSKLNQTGLYGSFNGTYWNINDLSFSNIYDDILPDSADVVLSHNSLGQLDSIYYVLPKIITNFTYDNMSWLTSIHSSITTDQTLTHIFTQLLQRDHRGNIVGESNLLGNLPMEASNSIYNYDSYNQLTNSNIISKGFSYNNNYNYDCHNPTGSGYTFGNRTASFEQEKSIVNDASRVSSNKSYFYDHQRKNQLNRYHDNHIEYGREIYNIKKYSYYGDGALSARSLFSNNNSAIFANIKQNVEQFDYDYRGLMNRYRKGEVLASDTCEISQMLLTDVEWQYRYNPFGERESKYMTVNSLDERKLRPMEYYLLGPGNEQFAVYNGFSIASGITGYYPYENSFYPINLLPDSNKKYIYPTEYNVYSGEGVFSSYRLAYAHTQKNYFIYNHLGSKAVEVDSAGNIIDYVQYSPFGEPLKKNNYQPQWNERLGYIDKEKDRESKLGDHGVRKYDYEIGRFTSIDPLWEEYTGWTGYQYSMNNPVNASDGNGKWVKEVSAEWHADLARYFQPNIERNSNGYLANKLNNEFYAKWLTNSPRIANKIRNNNIYVLQKRLDENVLANADLNGDIIRVDLSGNKSKDLESTLIHEITHLDGATEFQAYAAEYAAGGLSKGSILEIISKVSDTNIHFRKGMPKELRSKYFDGSGNFTENETLRNEFFEILKTEGNKWIR